MGHEAKECIKLQAKASFLAVKKQNSANFANKPVVTAFCHIKVAKKQEDGTKLEAYI